MGNSLVLTCTHCGNQTEHAVVRTLPSTYFWSEEHSRYFRLMFGEDVRYRKRERACGRCGTTTPTVELRESSFRSLVGEIDRLNALLGREQARPQAVGMRYLGSACDLVATIYGGTAKDEEEFDAEDTRELLDLVDQWLSTLPPDLSKATRLLFHLWGAPPSIDDVHIDQSRLLSALRHPEYSQPLRPALDMIEP